MVGSKSTILVANEETKQLETIEIWGGKEHEMIGKKWKKTALCLESDSVLPFNSSEQSNSEKNSQKLTPG